MSFLGAEWTYMLTKRIVAGNDSAFSFVRIKYGNHPTDTVTGVIIFPDDFSFADAGAPMLQFGAYPLTEIEKADWEAFEAWGCVFLPCTAPRDFTAGAASIGEAAYGLDGTYWSSIAENKNNGGNASFTPNYVNKLTVPNNNYRAKGLPVRLAQDYR